MSSIKSNSDFITLINSPKKSNYLNNIKKQCLEISEFNIINFPESGVEFLKKTNGSCFYCNEKNLSSYLCLFCGKKMCNNNHCFLYNKSKKRKEFSFIYHSKKCCGGNALFLNMRNCEIEYILKRRIIKSKIFVYLNDFGETIRDYYMNDKYKLNRDELKKGINIFIDMTYRKKLQKK